MERPALSLCALPDVFPKPRSVLRKKASPSREAHAHEVLNPTLQSTAGRDFGTRMHDILATIEWVDYCQSEAVEKELNQVPADLDERLRNLLTSDHGQSIFAKPATPVTLWREKPYAIRKGDALSQGIIDRAVVYLNSEGKPERIVIYDFKTDKLDPSRSTEEQLRERYQTQLERYQEAAALLTGVPLSAIETILVPV